MCQTKAIKTVLMVAAAALPLQFGASGYSQDDAADEPAQETAETTLDGDVDSAVTELLPGVGEPGLDDALVSRVQQNEGLDDVAFNLYFDPFLLSKSWFEMNPEGLADVALQMAEAERILQRPHKQLSADKLMDVALKAAVAKKDTDTLGRLARGAKMHGKDELAEKIAGLEKVVGASRAATPEVTISADTTSPEALDLYQKLRQSILAAKLSNDAEGLDIVADALDEADQLSDAQHERLVDLLEAAQESMSEPDDSANETIDLLNKLAAGSRGGLPIVGEILGELGIVGGRRQYRQYPTRRAYPPQQYYPSQPAQPRYPTQQPPPGYSYDPPPRQPQYGSDPRYNPAGQPPGGQYNSDPQYGSGPPSSQLPPGPQAPSGFANDDDPGFAPDASLVGGPSAAGSGTAQPASQGAPPRWLLGVRLGEFDPEWGVRIVYIYPESPASAAGLKLDDWIVSVDGRRMSSTSDFQDLIGYSANGYVRLAKLDPRTGRTTIRGVQLKSAQ